MTNENTNAGAPAPKPEGAAAPKAPVQATRGGVPVRPGDDAREPRRGGPRMGGPRQGGGPRRGGPGGRGGKGGGRQERVKPEFDQKTLVVRRVARVVAGGRRFSFAVAIAIGDRKGKVGVGTGKAGDVAGAMEKANKNAKKNMITLKLTKNNSLPHEVSAKYSSGCVAITPALSRGLVAGSAVRNVLELAGVTDVTSKIHSGSKNKLNIARATIAALSKLRAKK